jgi:hypothetical protein
MAVPFLTPSQIAELCHFCALSDREARSDLIIGSIVSENDYTSNFTGALRRNINSYSRTGLTATSRLLTPKIERSTGCDAAVVVQANDFAKVLLIEGKWPKISVPNHAWDWSQTATGHSHFSDQLARQAQHIRRYAIPEMFYCEFPFGKQPPYMNLNGSSCVWHADAVAHDGSRPGAPSVWGQADLISMLGKGTHSIEHIVEQVCLCRMGSQLAFPDAASLDGWDFDLPANVLLVTADRGALDNTVERTREE